MQKPRIGIVVVAYNAAGTLAQVLDRIPTGFRDQIAEVLVCDDHSSDSTYLVGLGYQSQTSDLPITLIRHPRNLGYGGNQKAAYRIASEHGLDIAVLLHGDGQYAPELLPEMVGPLIRGECDAVLGSRMMIPGAARRGGMPLYKYVGNKILTRFENRMLQVDLSEFHSGYRAFRVDVLDSLPLAENSDGFDFDTQILIQLIHSRRRILEIPIPTYYGEEICYVNGLRYARDISAEALRYRLGELGLGNGPRCLSGLASTPDPYAFKASDNSSHGQLLDWLGRLPPGRVLDLGCSAGHLAEHARKLGHVVTGVDVEQHEGVEERVDEFVRADLDRGIPPEIGGDFDTILMADVIEHVRQPEALLADASKRLLPGGRMFASVPNFGHWYPRSRTALGVFDYDHRGILDRGHVRFFTKRSFEQLVSNAGLTVRRRGATGLPLDVLRSEPKGVWSVVEKVDRAGMLLRPQLFAYQLLYELEPRADATIDEAVIVH